MKGSLLESLAALLVVIGVCLIASAGPSLTQVGSLAAYIGGITLLTLGVRLAIECGQAER